MKAQLARGEIWRRHGAAVSAATALALAVLLALWVAAGVADSPSEAQLFLGRLHPLIVHLPIGFVLLTVALEGLGRTRRFAGVAVAVPLALILSALSAVAAVAAGYLLGQGGGYSGALVAWHERLGFTLAACVTLAAALRYVADVRPLRGVRRAYAAVLALAVGVLVATGHLGGTLSRGPDYLTEYMPAPMLALARLLPQGEDAARPGFTYPDEARVYEHLVAPVLAERCVSCHGPEKQRGDLRLDSPEAITAGGTSGPVIVPGRAAESRMIRRVWLPPGHEDVMPPRGRASLSAAEAELLRWWVERGASFDQVVGRAAPPAGVLAILEQVAGPPEERIAPILRTDVPPADSAAYAAAEAAGWSLRPLAAGSPFLRARCGRAGEACGTEQLRALQPLAVQLAELDLSGAEVGDEDLALVGALPHLTRLALDRTAVTDAGMGALAGLQHLESLNLYGTAVTDAGVASLEPLASLRVLHLWRTGATEAGAERLTERLPHLRVELGLGAAAMDSLAEVS